MNEELELVVNRWYKQWCGVHDPFMDDFENEIDNALPNRKFTLDIANDRWIYLGER